tara:strand:+ start:169 stop:1083 length:915 start_codon:yes stop_codon:yes gene_type:complete
MFCSWLLFFLFFCPIFADTFSTVLGNCTLEIYGGRIDDIPEFVQLIKDETENLTKEFGKVQSFPFTVYITSNIKDFNEKTKGPVPEWGIAVAKLNPDRIIMKAPGIANISFTRMKEVMVHELNHIYMFRLPNFNTIPSWFKEGMAMRSSNEFSLLHKIELSKHIWQKQTIPLMRLKHISSYSRNKVKLAYGESAASIEALKYYYGEDILNNIITNLHHAQNFDEALIISIDEEFVDFQIKFEQYLETNYNWIFLLRASRYIYVILPLILVLGYIYHRYRSNKILAKWELEEHLENIEWNEKYPN